jgi:hypothetical protein
MLSKEIVEYKDYIYQVHGEPRVPGQLPGEGISQNGQLYLAQTHLLLHLRNEMTHEFYPEWVKMMEACKYKDGGIYIRHNVTHCDNWQSPDNFIGIACSSAVFNHPAFCKDIVEYGQKDRGYKLKDLLAELPATTWTKIAGAVLGWMPLYYVYKWEPDHKLQQCWLGRQLGLIAVMKWAAGMNPSFIEKVVHCISLVIACTSEYENIKNVDPANLGWMCVNVAKGKSWWCDLVGKYFMYKVKKKYEGLDFGAIYWPKNTAHPNAKHFVWE